MKTSIQWTRCGQCIYFYFFGEDAKGKIFTCVRHGWKISESQLVNANFAYRCPMFFQRIIKMEKVKK